MAFVSPEELVEMDKDQVLEVIRGRRGSLPPEALADAEEWARSVAAELEAAKTV